MKLRVVDDIVAMVGRMHDLARDIGKRDGDLAKQLRTASSSVGLNAGEGLHARAGSRTSRFETAMCSGREVAMALRIAGAARYLPAGVVSAEADNVDRIVATLYKLTYRK